jgi:hypothetical protein
VVEASDESLAYVKTLGERAERIQQRAVHPSEDNMLKVSGNDVLDLLADEGSGTKVSAVADRVAVPGQPTRIGSTASRSPKCRTRGALQMVFCDLGTPREDWNVYDELKDLLVERGVSAEQIAFIHSAKNDRAREALFDAAKTGQVQVLLGSTSKMGVGTNAQDRVVALHHVDCPWRPADIIQRVGRGRRQGNQNPEIEILRYVTEGTFDTYS